MFVHNLQGQVGYFAYCPFLLILKKRTMGFIQDLGDSLLDTTTDVIDSFGDRITNATDAREVAIQAASANIQIAKQRAIEAEKRKNRLTTIAEWTIGILLTLVVLSVALDKYKKLKL